MPSLHYAEAVADILWDSCLKPPDLPIGDAGLASHYRKYIYRPLSLKVFREVARHHNPEPWLTMVCALQFLSGDGWRRSDRRFEGVVGDRLTELEYQLLKSGQTNRPLVFIAGFPRSGTTSAQAVARRAFSSSIPEIDSKQPRFSLWEYPKHDFNAARQLALLGDEAVRLTLTVRNFLDVCASLVVGRGGAEYVDVQQELENWRAWIPISRMSNVFVLPFQTISSSTPMNLAREMARGMEVDALDTISSEVSYKDLMVEIGKGDAVSGHQSNLPSASRSVNLSEARNWVESQLSCEDRESIDNDLREMTEMRSRGSRD